MMNCRRILLLIAAIALGLAAIQPSLAQRGGGRSGDREQRSPEEVQKAREEARAKMFEVLQIEQPQQVLVAALLDSLEMERQQIMEDARSGPRDPEVFRMIRQDMEDLAKVYDERLLEVLGEETFKLYATYRDAVRAARGEGRGRRGRSGGGRRGGDR
ncbi:MAG: hypothetical protein HN559_21345 [Gemmatimonadetes bacterium]|jgi:hypothetical protein|nr:hypothetical protein [Gemmatimonadota bacterium]MBT7597463.1 hypothetical protein [Gemmatimonadota bacterium]